MSTLLKAVRDYRAEFLALADGFDQVAAKEILAEPASGGLYDPPPPNEHLLIRRKAIRDQRTKYDELMKTAANLLIALSNNEVINELRLKAFVAAFEERSYGPLLQHPANLFSLYVGGPRIELKDAQGRSGEYETHGNGCPPQLREILQNTGRLVTASMRALGELNPWPVDQTQCRRYATMCRTLAAKIPATAVATTTQLVVGSGVEGEASSERPAEPLQHPKANPNKGNTKSWNHETVDQAIRDFKLKYSEEYFTYHTAIQGADTVARTKALNAARKRFGRNAIADAIGCKNSRALVSQSRTWKGIAAELHLSRKSYSEKTQSRGKTIGFDIADEKAAKGRDDDPVVEEVSRREMISIVGKSPLPQEQIDALIGQLEAHTTSPEEAEKILNELCPKGRSARRQNL